MNPIISKLSLVTLFLLFFGVLSPAKPTTPGPVCVPNDTKCLHPEQPMADMNIPPVVPSNRVDLVMMDEDNGGMTTPYYHQPDLRMKANRAERKREHERERYEAWKERQHHNGNNHGDETMMGR